MVHFFSATTQQKEINAPLTNLGCESVFSGFGNDCKRAERSTFLKTLSNKATISDNKFLQKTDGTCYHKKNEENVLSGQETAIKRRKLKRWKKNFMQR